MVKHQAENTSGIHCGLQPTAHIDCTHHSKHLN